jgi:alpha/beta hydrolase family protein/adenylate/guanylate cyclase family protein
MEDVRVIMDEVGSDQAALLGFGGGGMMSMLFAATYPQRTSALVLVNSFARLSEAPDYPGGRASALEDEVLDVIQAGWGRAVLLDLVAPDRVGDAEFRQWWARYQRLGLSLGGILAVRRMLGEADVREVLPMIRVPTLVLYRTGDTWVRPEHGRYLSENIAGAKLVELPGTDYFVFLGDADGALEEIEEFVTGIRHPPEVDRVLATLLFTDIVESTRRAAELGDRRWAEVLADHHRIVRRELERFRGREVDTAGDGFFATFDGPARAVRCALALRDALRPLGLDIRAGLHTGELELQKGGVRGLAIYIGQRLTACSFHA